MSHEVRTPLNAIIGFSYILKQELKGPLCADQQDYMSRIYDSGNYQIPAVAYVWSSRSQPAPTVLHSKYPTPIPTSVNSRPMPPRNTGRNQKSNHASSRAALGWPGG